ncbi:MAG: helix-turn-helix domain-containing protein [Bacteroidota bacterium]
MKAGLGIGRFWFFAFWLLCSAAASTAVGQLRIEVVKHPPFTLKDSSIFISGTFNQWSPGEERYKMTRGANGVYFFELPDTLSYFEYKFTQGGWIFVEGTREGSVRPNRVYNRDVEPNPKLVSVEIEGWEKQPSYTLVVKKIPKNTPHDATLYVMGDFNNWNPADRSYQLNKQIDVTYRVIIYNSLEKMSFKFTRGTAESVESRASGRILYNRVLVHNKVRINSNVEMEIAGWNDLPGANKLYSIYDLLLLFSFFQGVLLIITVPSIQGYNRSANRWLLLLIGVSSVILASRVIVNYPSVVIGYPKLQLISDFIFFIYSPLFFFYLQRLLFQSRQVSSLSMQWHFVPALAQFFIYMVYFFLDDSTFEAKLYNQQSDLYVTRVLVACGALIFNSFYWVASQRAINRYKLDYKNSSSYEQNLQFLKTVLFIQAVCLVAWAFSTGIALVGWWKGFDLLGVFEFLTETIWIVFSFITFFLGYFAIHEPDVFRVPDAVFGSEPTIALANIPLPIGTAETKPAQLEAPAEETEDLPIENLEEEVRKLSAYMETKKPYTNPKLTLVELAKGLNLPPYQLSKIINNGFDKNFFDFVNSYRIEEFKKRVEDPQFKNHTLLSIAFDVGFNSKTAFNRSFKKITNQTPSTFFNNMREY